MPTARKNEVGHPPRKMPWQRESGHVDYLPRSAQFDPQASVGVTRRYFFLPQSSSASRFTAGASDFPNKSSTRHRIAECIRSGGVWEAESNIKLLGLVPAPATAHWDAPFTVERVKF